jgi:hypothetical protein
MQRLFRVGRQLGSLKRADPPDPARPATLFLMHPAILGSKPGPLALGGQWGNVCVGCVSGSHDLPLPMCRLATRPARLRLERIPI